MTATKIQPGDDTHLTSLMAPHSLNFVTGVDRAALLAYGRDVFAAARASQCLAQPIAGYRISDPSDPTIKPWLSDTPDDNGYTSEPLYAGAAPAAVAPQVVVAWMHPETLNVISAAHKHDMSTEYGAETRRKAESYSVALVRAGEPAAAAPALEAPAAPSEADIASAREHIADVHNATQMRSALSQLRPEVVVELVARGLVPSIYAPMAAAPQAPAAAWTMPVMQVRPLETAPKDGTIVQLLVQFVDHPPGQKSVLNGAGPLYDTADPCWTIGGNTVENAGVDHWQFVGWNWEQDCFVDTSTDSGHRVLGWAPFDVAAPAAPAVDAGDPALPSWWPDFIQCVAELPDRNSPEDEPDAMIATAEELSSCALAAQAKEGGA